MLGTKSPSHVHCVYIIKIMHELYWIIIVDYVGSFLSLFTMSTHVQSIIEQLQSLCISYHKFTHVIHKTHVLLSYLKIEK